MTSTEYEFLTQFVTDGNSPVSRVLFDGYDELVWMGGHGGHVTSYFSSACEKYTSFQAHPQGHAVLDMATHPEGVLSLSQTAVRLNSRRGPTKALFNSSDFTNLNTMSLWGKNEHRLAVSGYQPTLWELDLQRGSVIRSFQLEDQESGYKIIKANPQTFCCADFYGNIDIRSKDTFKTIHKFETSSLNLIHDMAVLGNQVVTTGYTESYNRSNFNMYLKIYDLRSTKPASHLLPTLFPPAFVKFLEMYTSKVMCMDTMGNYQTVDIDRRETLGTVHVPNHGSMSQLVTCFDLSPTGQAFVHGDDAGMMSLFGTHSSIHFINGTPNTEFADVVEPLPPMDVLDPLNIYSSIPAPYTNNLLSDLHSSMTKFRYHVPKPIDPSILGSIKMAGNLGYAPNHGRLRRNECPYITNEQQLKKQTSSPVNDGAIPAFYQKVDIKYNKLGIEDFDYNQFNSTCFAGLESSMPNCYSNDMLQVLYYLSPLRKMLKSHGCDREFCLACELAYLFHMLETSDGMPCQASNFLRAFRTIPQVSGLGLLINEDRFSDCKQLIQGWTRFMFTQLNIETTDEDDPNTSAIRKLFSFPQEKVHLCRCTGQSCSLTSVNMIDMKYPLSLDTGAKNTFSSLLRSSMRVEESISTYCEKCGRFSSGVIHTKTLKGLPDILVINTDINTSTAYEIWGLKPDAPAANLGQGGTALMKCRFGEKCTRKNCTFDHSTAEKAKSAGTNRGKKNSFLPSELNIALFENGKIDVKENACDAGGSNYELTAMVCVVSHDNRENIISVINVAAEYHELHSMSSHSQWYVFNDFTVQPVSESEVFAIDVQWKQPCMLYYSRKDLPEKYKDLKIVSPITEDIIRKDTSIISAARKKKFTPLGNDEHLRAGDIVAMDAEFVTLNQEEAEIRSDGTRATIRPSQRSVARISCLRGQGDMEGVAFIDDYIATQEQVVDYLTQFSGIQPGDLDVSLSSKYLTTLKSTYQKLRFLVDRGVKFVGHGLKNDFRVINLVVPQSQVLDTVLLFQLRNKRMLSLRFLAWHFFGETIQSETHDSIEDASTALRLYRKYEELQERNDFDAALTELYEVGKKYNWKIPEENSQSNDGTPAAPLD